MQHNLWELLSYSAANQVEALAPRRERGRDANQVESSDKVFVCVCVFVRPFFLLLYCARGAS